MNDYAPLDLKPGPRWEYGVLTVADLSDTLQERPIRLHFSSTAAVPSLSITSFPGGGTSLSFMTLSELGEHGWELVGFEQASTKSRVYYFKRPRI